MIRSLSALAALWGAMCLLSSLPAMAADDPFAIDKDRIGENADFNFDELEGKLSLRFYDAVSGKPISGARVTLNERSAISDAGGRVVFPFPRLDREEGDVFALFDKQGYIKSKVPIHIIMGSVFIHRYSISPELPPGRYRITVDWASEPPDLDAHLVKQGRYHISFRDMKKYEDQAWLDRDDVDGEGPETITVARLDPRSSYTFFVHDYTHRKDGGFAGFEKSKAHVMVFNEGGLVQSFRVIGGPGTVWKVFSIQDGQIVPGSEMLTRIP